MINIRETRLIWLGHVERMVEEDVVMRTWKLEVDGHRKTGRPKLRWSDVIRKYKIQINLLATS